MRLKTRATEEEEKKIFKQILDASRKVFGDNSQVCGWYFCYTRLKHLAELNLFTSARYSYRLRL